MASIKPRVYYGLHMVEGVAEYDEGKGPFRYLINEKTCKEMDPTYEGCPVYVRHVPEVDLKNLQNEADGYVSQSFFNPPDGRHWVKFMVVSDKGHEAIAKGWKLSNAYVINESASGGEWHGVPFQKQVTRAEYEHLAIVPNPRYSESVILTPEQFKNYNAEKEQELVRLANEKKEVVTMFNWIKRDKVANEKITEIESMVVVLPKSKVEKTITQLVNESDEAEEKGKSPQMANADHMVQVNGEKMSVGALVSKHQDCMNDLEELKKKHVDGGEDDEEKKKAQNEAKFASEKEKLEKAHNDAIAKLAKDHGQEAPAPVVKNEVKTEEELRLEKEQFEKIKNAHNKGKDLRTVETGTDQLSRGKSRYGSN